MRKVTVKPKKPVKKVTKAKVHKIVQAPKLFVKTAAVNPAQVLKAGAQHMDDRAEQYDAPRGERSMEKTMSMFNTLTGHNLSETEGWKFMALLKMVRASTGPFKLDNYEDLVAYSALAAESHSVDK